MMAHVAIYSGAVRTVIALEAKTWTEAGHLGKYQLVMVPCKVGEIIFIASKHVWLFNFYEGELCGF